MEFKIISLNVGKVGELISKKGKVASAYRKQPVAKAELSDTGFAIDEQADLKNHGGVDKAVCVYSSHHFGDYSEFLNITEMPIPAFGENFTVDSLDEAEIFIGDIFECGKIKLQISQPRQPCSKTGLFYSNNKVIKFMSVHGSTGFYFRVLRGGQVNAGDIFKRTFTDSRHSLKYANDLMYRRVNSLDKLREFIDNEFLSKAWKDELSGRLK